MTYMGRGQNLELTQSGVLWRKDGPAVDPRAVPPSGHDHHGLQTRPM